MGENRNLYDGVPSEERGHRFIVDVRENSPEDHDLWIGGDRESGKYVCLQRGFLREFSEANVERVAQGLGTLTQGHANFYMAEHGITYEELALVLAQARIKEMENEVVRLEEKNADLRLERPLTHGGCW